MPQPILIGGDWKAGRGPVVTSLYPHDQSVSGEVTGATPADVDDAVQAGKRVLADPRWRDLLPALWQVRQFNLEALAASPTPGT